MSDNGNKQITEEKIQSLSVQERTERQAHQGGSGVIWFHRLLTAADEIWPWWAPRRDADLRQFVRLAGNDILQGAVSSIIKKFKAMNWVLEGPDAPVKRGQFVLSNAEFGKGWGVLLSKVLYDYLTQDRGAFVELIGEGKPDGPMKGLPLGIAHLDASQCQLTGDIDFPVIFNNAKDQHSRKLHATRVIHLVDLPNPDEEMNDVGFCATSRVVASSQVLLKLSRYKNQKLDDLPPAGLLLLNNILPQQWDDTNADYQKERRRLGSDLWSNVMTLFSLDPAQPATAELIDFASLPDNFDENTATNLYVNIVALAFGVDVREFWPISAGPLGTAAETEVQHQKARGKGVGEIISMLEREINWKILPKSVDFRFDFQDDEEDLLRADIIDKKTKTIMSMWQLPNQNQADLGIGVPVTRDEIRQMLADQVPYFKEDFLAVDVTEEVEATDTEQHETKIITMDRKGNVRLLRTGRKQLNYALAKAEENYRAGLISIDDLLSFRLGEVIDGR